MNINEEMRNKIDEMREYVDQARKESEENLAHMRVYRDYLDLLKPEKR